MSAHLGDGKEPSVTTLVGGIVADAQELIRQQFDLLRQELQQELARAKTAAITLGIGVGIAACGGVMLMVMLVHLLAWSTTIPLWGCYAIVGGVLFIVGVTLYFRGVEDAGKVRLMPPPQTSAALKENLRWLTNETTSESINRAGRPPN